MIRIQQLKLPISHTEEQLKQKIAKMLRVPVAEIKLYKIRKQSIDARKKQEVSYVYTVDVQVPGEEKLLKNLKVIIFPLQRMKSMIFRKVEHNS